MRRIARIPFGAGLLWASVWINAPGQAADVLCQGQSLLDAGWVWSDVVLRATVERVDECPPGASGAFAEAAQYVEYRVTRVFKGTLPDERLHVAHHIVSGAALVSPDTPCLRETIFHEGADLVVFARWDYQQERFETYHPSYGVVPARDSAVTHLARINDECATAFSSEGPSTTAARDEKHRVKNLVPCIGEQSSRRARRFLSCLLGSETEVTERSVAPGGMWAATEISNGYATEVLIEQREAVCPPRLLSSRGVRLQGGEIAADHAGAASVVWLDGDRLVFLDSPDSFQAKNEVYEYSTVKGVLKAIAVDGKPRRLYAEDGQVLCAIEQKESGKAEAVMLDVGRSGKE